MIHLVAKQCFIIYLGNAFANVNIKGNDKLMTHINLDFTYLENDKL